jgi:hypothetical protein
VIIVNTHGERLPGLPNWITNAHFMHEFMPLTPLYGCPLWPPPAGMCVILTLAVLLLLLAPPYTPPTLPLFPCLHPPPSALSVLTRTHSLSGRFRCVVCG